MTISTLKISLATALIVCASFTLAHGSNTTALHRILHTHLAIEPIKEKHRAPIAKLA